MQRVASLPADGVAAPGKRTYTRMSEHRPAMTTMLMAALSDAVGQHGVIDVLHSCAGEYAKKHCSDGATLDTKYLANDTYNRLLLHGHVSDLPRSGKPQSVTDTQVDEFLDIFLAGNGKDPADNDWWGYTSMTHALVENERLRALLEAMGIKQETLWKRMKQRYKARFGKRLKKISIRRKPKLQPKVKKERVRIARLWKQWGKGKLCKVVWIDEKQEYLHPGGTYKCYAPHGVKSMQREVPVALGKAEKVKYEAAVSAFGGAIYFQFVTGTTGRKQPFLVRTFVPLWRHLDPATTGASVLPSLIEQLHLDVCILPADAQDAKVLFCSCGAGLAIHFDVLLVVWLVRPVLPAIEEHEQAALVRKNVRLDHIRKDEHVHADCF